MAVKYSLWHGDERIAVDVFAFNVKDYPGGSVAVWHTGNTDPSYPDCVYAAGTWTHILKGEDDD